MKSWSVATFFDMATLDQHVVRLQAALRGLHAQGLLVNAKKGDVLFKQGEDSTWLFHVTEGRLFASVGCVPLRELAPGDIGGLSSLVKDHNKRSATISVVSPQATYVRWERDAFQLAMRKDTALAFELFRYEANKVRDKNTKLSQLLLGIEESERTLAKPAAGGASQSPAAAQPPCTIAMFDTKPYDQQYFEAAVGSLHLGQRLRLKYLDSKLTLQTVLSAAGCSAVCVFVNDSVDATVLQTLGQLGVKLLLLRCAGFNNVDLAAAAAAGIDVVRVPAYSPYAVAEHAIALLQTVNRKTNRAYNRVREGNFSLSGLVGIDLHGATVGIVGTGKIGKCFAAIVKGMGMKVLVHDPFPDAKWAAEFGATYVSGEELMARSDVISLHCPLTPETRHFINYAALEKLKRGVIVINTGRGGLINHEALVQGLRSGVIGAAGLDVYENEADFFFEDRSHLVISDVTLSLLMGFPNVIITSHQAFLTREALNAIAQVTLKNAVEWLDGRRGSALTNAVIVPKPKL